MVAVLAVASVLAVRSVLAVADEVACALPCPPWWWPPWPPTLDRSPASVFRSDCTLDEGSVAEAAPLALAEIAATGLDVAPVLLGSAAPAVFEAPPACKSMNNALRSVITFADALLMPSGPPAPLAVEAGEAPGNASWGAVTAVPLAALLLAACFARLSFRACQACEASLPIELMDMQSLLRVIAQRTGCKAHAVIATRIHRPRAGRVIGTMCRAAS